jgi:hypothetical protein
MWPFVTKAYAAAESIIKTPIKNPTGYSSLTGGGLTSFITNLIRLAFVGAGVVALLNFIIAGYQYMNAGGDAKQLNAAWARIWQSLVGLVILAAAFALISLVGLIMFGKPDFILNPQIYKPGE